MSKVYYYENDLITNTIKLKILQTTNDNLENEKFIYDSLDTYALNFNSKNAIDNITSKKELSYDKELYYYEIKYLPNISNNKNDLCIKNYFKTLKG